MPTPLIDEPDLQLLHEIKQIVGESGWKKPEANLKYFEDPRGRFSGSGCIIVLPANTDQVSQIVQLCNKFDAGIIPYSGGTGVVAGQLSVSSENAIIMSLERMDKVRQISIDNSVITVEAGCILESIHSIASTHDMTFPLSMASKGSCCIGGNLATNAGGNQVLRHGNARDLCLGIEAVLPSGAILNELSPLLKNNTGYDIRHLLIGSEGTLGIITAASLKLKPIDPETGTALLAFDSPAAGLEIYKEIKTHLGESISALELLSGFGLELVTSKFPDLRNPFSHTPKWALLLEASGSIGINSQIETALAVCFEKELLSDAVIAQSQSQRSGLWDLRENTPEANRMAGAFCNSDTSVSIGSVDAFINDTVNAIFKIHPDLQINSYGHLGDGNIHHNVFPPKGISKANFVSSNPHIIDEVRMAINEVTHMHGGSISAEHGIGRLKTGDLETYLSKAKLDVIRQIKFAIDPKNIMNPGVIVS